MRNKGIAVTKGRNPAYKMLWPGLIVLVRGDVEKMGGKIISLLYDKALALLAVSACPAHK
jgi:hypothetical protein